MSAAENDREPVWLTKRQAADRFQLHVNTITRAMNAGSLRFIGGGHGVGVRFRVEWLDDWYRNRGRGKG